MKRLLCISVGCLTLIAFPRATPAWKAPQDNWVLENHRKWDVPGAMDIAVNSSNVFVTRNPGNVVMVYSRDGVFLRQFGGAGTADGLLSNPYGIACDSSEVFVADNGNARVQVFGVDGAFHSAWPVVGGVLGLAIDVQCVYVTCSSLCNVQVFRRDGTPVNAWGSQGTLPGQFKTPWGIALDQYHVYVADKTNKRIQVFTKQGKFVRMWELAISDLWGGSGHSGEPHQGPFGIAVDSSNVYVGIGNKIYDYNWYSRIQVFDKSGVFKWQHVTGHTRNYASHSPTWGEPLSYPWGMSVDGPLLFVADNGVGDVTVCRRMFRTLGSASSPDSPQSFGAPISVLQRSGTSLLDIDYIVSDDDTPTVTAYPLAFTNATPSLMCCVPLRTLVEGTEANIGTNVAVGVTNRISWDVGADWQVDYGDLRIAILAKDDRQLLDIHWLHMPAVGANPPLTINRYPITANDLLNLWFWVIASKTPGAALANGEVRGVGGDYDGVLLADDTGTTAEGRAFLFALLGCRQATPAELQQAREASTPGSVTQWDPRYKLPNGVPKKINEFGFDTGSTDADGWWVVKE